MFAVMWLAPVALLATSAQASFSAPLKWMNAQAKGFVSMPTGAFVRNLRGPQELVIRDADSTERVIYFTAKLDQTIALDDMGWCIEAGGDKSGDVVYANRCTGGPAQKWNWIPDGHGRNMIQLKGSSMCLDVVDHGSHLNSAAIQLQECDNTLAESWKFEQPSYHQQLSRSLRVSSDMRHVMISLIVLAGVGVMGLAAWLGEGEAQSLPSRQLMPQDNNRKVHRSRASRICMAEQEFNFDFTDDDEKAVVPEEEPELSEIEKENARLRAAEKFMLRPTGNATCQTCGYKYMWQEWPGGPTLAKNTTFDLVPDSWACPNCKSPKAFFIPETTEIAGYKENQEYGFGGNSLTESQKTNLIFGGLALFFIVFLGGYALN